MTEWRIDVPMVMEDHRGRSVPWTLNDRTHWTKRRTNAARIRSDVAWLVKAVKIPHQDHVTVQLHYAPGDNRRRDADNLVASAKPAVDALVTAGVVDDDRPEFVTHLMPVIHGGRGDRALWLIVRAELVA